MGKMRVERKGEQRLREEKMNMAKVMLADEESWEKVSRYIGPSREDIEEL